MKKVRSATLTDVLVISSNFSLSIATWFTLINAFMCANWHHQLQLSNKNVINYHYNITALWYTHTHTHTHTCTAHAHTHTHTHTHTAQDLCYQNNNSFPGETQLVDTKLEWCKFRALMAHTQTNTWTQHVSYLNVEEQSLERVWESSAELHREEENSTHSYHISNSCGVRERGGVQVREERGRKGNEVCDVQVCMVGVWLTKKPECIIVVTGAVLAVCPQHSDCWAIHKLST